MAEALTEEEEFALSRAEPKPRWTRYQLYVIGLLLVVAVTSGLDRHILAILQEPMKGELKLTDAQLGLINGPAFAIFYAFSAIPIARLAERMARPRLLAAVLSVWTSATALCGLAANFAGITLCRVGVGLGEGGAHPICQSMVADNFTARQRGTAMAIYALGPPIASIIAPWLGGLVASHYGWRVAFGVIGAPGLILAAVVWFTLRESRRQSEGERRPPTFTADMGWLMRNHAFVCIFIGGAFNGLGITGISAFVPSFLMRTQGFNIGKAGGIVGVLGVMAFMGTLLGGWLADRFADARGRSYVYVISIGALFTGGFYLLAFTQADFRLVLLGLLGANLATNMKNGPNFAAIQNIAPSTMRATSAAVFTIASNVIGAGLGAWLIGMMSDAASAHAFAGSFGTFAAACPGGHPAHGAAADLVGACKAASGTGLRTALALTTSVFLASGFFFWLAGQKITINKD